MICGPLRGPVIASVSLYSPKKHKRFGIKIYKLCDRTGHTYDTEIYLGKGRKHATTDMTEIHATAPRTEDGMVTTEWGRGQVKRR